MIGANNEDPNQQFNIIYPDDLDNLIYFIRNLKKSSR